MFQDMGMCMVSNDDAHSRVNKQNNQDQYDKFVVWGPATDLAHGIVWVIHPCVVGVMFGLLRIANRGRGSCGKYIMLCIMQSLTRMANNDLTRHWNVHGQQLTMHTAHSGDMFISLLLNQSNRA